MLLLISIITILNVLFTVYIMAYQSCYCPFTVQL